MSAMLAPVRAAEMTVTSALLNKAAAESDMAIVTIGEVSGEGYDRPLENGFNLSDVQKQLIKNTIEAFHKQGKKVVVVLNICGIVEVASWRDMPDAILLAWAGGQETGNSMADILSGKVNPSGKLAVSIPMSYEDVPSAKNFPGVITGPEKMVDMGFAKMSFAPSRVVYEEGIYNGYRYYESFGVAPAYEFGFGKSYTTFDYGKVTMSGTVFNKELKVTLDVKNSGGIAGKEVVELYLTAPANKLDKPGLELKGFVKTRLLQPGETQTVEFTIIPRNLASFDTSVSSWIAEAGTYEVKVGASSRDIRQTATFELKKELVVKKESRALTPQENINELKATRTALK
jgi:beta-glucosidase